MPRATLAPNPMRKGASGETATKTATPSPRSGTALPVGAHPGNTGGKKGRSGRKPDEFKHFMQRLVGRKDVCAALAKVLRNPAHPHFVPAYKMACEFGYGRATQALEHSGAGGGPVRVHVRHTVVDPSAPRG